MIVPDQTRNRTDSRSLGSSYINLASRFDQSLQSSIPVIHFAMKLQHPCENSAIKKAFRTVSESYKILMIRLDVRRSETTISYTTFHLIRRDYTRCECKSLSDLI